MQFLSRDSAFIKNFYFTGGTVLGMGVTGLATLGIGLLLCALFYFLAPQDINTTSRATLLLILETITGFSLGFSSDNKNQDLLVESIKN